MSSIVSRTLPITFDNITTYWTAGGGMDFRDAPYCMSVSGKTSYCYATVNDVGKNVLFPNGTARPVKLDFKAYIGNARSIGSHTNYGAFFVNGEQLAAGTYSGSSGNTPYSTTGNTSAAVTDATKSTSIQIGMKTSGVLYNARFDDNGDSFIRLYFTQYDFAATAGTGIASATATAHGYNGDTVTFSATPASGYAFAGWYSGDTLVSSDAVYSRTVAGADLTLTARAEALPTRTVNISYDGTTIATAQEAPPVSIGYMGATIATVGAGQTKTLVCDGKLMRGNVTVGGKTLTCAGKIMHGNVAVTME